jgi:hypothetical protein
VEIKSVRIAFPDDTPDRAGNLAEDLAEEVRREVRDNGKPVQGEVRRTDPEAQDFGTTLVILLGTRAVVILARAIRDWARRKEQATIEINGVRVVNVASQDVAEIVRA